MISARFSSGVMTQFPRTSSIGEQNSKSQRAPHVLKQHEGQEHPLFLSLNHRLRIILLSSPGLQRHPEQVFVTLALPLH